MTSAWTSFKVSDQVITIIITSLSIDYNFINFFLSFVYADQFTSIQREMIWFKEGSLKNRIYILQNLMI